MAVVKIALLQMAATSQDAEHNRLKGDEFCRKAATMGADIALFPEMWSNGYAHANENDPSSLAAWSARSLSRDSAYVNHFRKLAVELDMAIALTYLEKTSTDPANSMTLIDRRGHDVLTYSKVHTCDWGFEGKTRQGDDFYVAALDTKVGSIQIGAMICFDREHPESARILMLKGAELVLVPNACFLDELRLTQFRVRSYENTMALAMTNYANLQGRSIAFTGIPDDNEHKLLAIQADETEGVFIAEIDIARLRQYRPDSIWGNRFRRPSRYSALVSQNVVAPFDHAEARR